MPAKNLQVLKIDPVQVLTFKGPYTEVVITTITLFNPTDDKVAFKVKTTAPKYYLVRPNCRVLNKGESITVSVMRQPFDFNPGKKTKHKFMIQSIVMVGESTQADVWKDTEPQKLMNTRLRVVFDMDSAPVSATTVPVSALGTLSTQRMNSKTFIRNEYETNEYVSITIEGESGGKNIENEYNRALEEIQRLLQEVASLKEESRRLKRVAMNGTIYAATQKSSQSQQKLPSGVGLLFHDMNNLIILIVLFIATFAAGVYMSPSIL